MEAYDAGSESPGVGTGAMRRGEGRGEERGAPPQIALLDETGTIVGVNEVWRRVAGAFGLSEEVSGPGVSYLAICDQVTGYGAESARAAGRCIRQVLAGEASETTLEYSCETPDGVRWASMTVSRLGYGSVVAAVSHYEITDLRATHSRLRARIRQLKAVAELGQRVLKTPSKDLLDLAVRSVARVLDVESCWLLKFLPGPQELVFVAGVNWKLSPETRIPVGDCARMKAQFALPSSETNNTESCTDEPADTCCGVCDLLQEHGLNSALTTALNTDGRTHGVLCACGDDLQRQFTADDRHFLQAIGHLAAEAIRLEDERTQGEQLEEKLRQAQKMETLGRLASGVAHDFNNLLMVIRGQCELLELERELDCDGQKKMSEIRWAIDRAARLTQQLLTFSRRQVVRLLPLSLNAVVGEMESMLRRLIGEHIRLELRLSPTAANLLGDRNQLEQVVINLAVNGRDAMPRGGELVIETREVALDQTFVTRHAAEPVEPGDYVLLRIQDQGRGVDPEVLPHIFEPFFTTKKSKGGTGLGLATVYGIVRQHHGCTRVQSQPGEGAVFEIYLPLWRGTFPTPDREGRMREVSGGGETILLVEDEKEVRSVTRQLLERWGYRVLEAGDGVAAQEWAERHDRPIHLLITDVVLPDTSGPEIAKAVADMRPGIKVIYLSGYAGDALQSLVDAGEAEVFLQKPVKPVVLSEKVRYVLDEVPTGG